MNKEECKSILLQQIKQQGSPFSVLMLNDSVESRNYHAHRKFTCSEFGFNFYVESLDDEGHFQVSFIECDALMPLWINTAIDISNKERIKNMVFTMESMDVSSNFVLFSVVDKVLDIEDYQFRFCQNPNNDYTSTAFQIVSGHIFGFGQYDAAIDFLKMTEKKRNGQVVCYIDSLVGDEDVSEIRSGCWPQSFSPEKINEYAAIFENAEKTKSQSQLMQIVLKLREIDNQLLNQR